MLTDQEINELLYSLPEGVADNELLQEVDLEYIPEERIKKLIYLIDHEHEYQFRFVYKASCLLCYWGIDRGFIYISNFLLNPNFEDIRNNYLDGEDYKYILEAIISFSYKINNEHIQSIRKKIYSCIETIINIAKIIPFSISDVYYNIEAGHIEYLPLVRDYLSCIVKNKEHNYWNINDASEILFKYYPEFVTNILKENNITLTHCNFKQNRWEKFIKELEELKQYHNHNK
ncbi:hypothetical protein NYR30_07445 [Gallibacterium salpingitidis]|uniref:hypothetical protein n=1 Tax=Gallibacterium salpingitidis TaxID=505341 RepID=UPI00266F3019|nr:hypothetical protein [Gallibacterium salpingitidis]WKS98618.1 hypothetical protein NYR30_07445 [Gallibacterium salpingitidis]